MTVYTIGHSNQTVVELLDLLKKHDIAMLVDVRSVPYSRRTPQFNREGIAEQLRACRIRYVFAGDCLGGRPTDSSCYKNGELADYEEVSKKLWYRKDIEELVRISGKYRTAIMCSEENPNQCHRHHLITKTLMELNIPVLHIRG
jgi:uncharacterized protein (DUF488 family)